MFRQIKINQDARHGTSAVTTTLPFAIKGHEFEPSQFIRGYELL